MALAEVFYAGVLLWTVAVWVGMLLCPHHPTLHRLLRTPHLVIAPHLILYLVLVLPPLFQGEVSVGKAQGSRHHSGLVGGLERVVVGFAEGLVGPSREVALAALNLFVGRSLFLESRQRLHRALLSAVVVATMLAAPLGLALHWVILIIHTSWTQK